MIITIDGTAGSGKSTAARNLSRRLHIPFLDTGAMYRAVTFAAMENGINLERDDMVTEIARNTDVRFEHAVESPRVFADGKDVTQEIRREEVSRNARYIASCPAARRILVARQRERGNDYGDFVTEGRDQGSVVFPFADYKFYLDAAPEERARRRFEELRARGNNPDADEVLRDMTARDHADKNRAVGPLTIPEGAIIINTGHLSPEETVATLMEHISPR